MHNTHTHSIGPVSLKNRDIYILLPLNMSKNIATFQKGFEHSLGNGFMFFSPSEVFGKRVDLSLTFDAIINRLKLLHIKKCFMCINK